VANTYGWGFVNINLRPYYSEGSKTLGYEVIEQLGWELPDHIVAPLASGSLFTKIRKGFDEFIKCGLVEEKAVRFSGAQAEGCNPIATAFREGRDFITPVKPNTIAKSIAIGNPADGPYAIDIANRTGGTITDVTDAEIIDGIKLLAETEGVFTETAGGTTIAVLKKLARSTLRSAPWPTSPATASRPPKLWSTTSASPTQSKPSWTASTPPGKRPRLAIEPQPACPGINPRLNHH
jgi:threonine synthase